MGKTPGKCIFCGRNVSRRGEHLWPKWMHEILPGEPYKGKDIWSGVVSESGLALTKHDMRQGASYTRTFKCVCATCNSEWMSRLETEVKEFVVPIVRGDRCTVGQSQLDTLSKWLTLKILVVENDNRDSAMTSEKECHAFKEFGVIPVNLRIWVGYMSLKQPWLKKLVYSPQWILTPGDSPHEKRPNLYAQMISFGSLVVFAINTNLAINLHKIWRRPVQGFELLFPRFNKRPRQQVWPMPVMLTGPYLDGLNASFLRFGDRIAKSGVPVP